MASTLRRACASCTLVAFQSRSQRCTPLAVFLVAFVAATWSFLHADAVATYLDIKIQHIEI